MRDKHNERYCVSPEALSLLRRDGIGWGHDLDCGCFHVEKKSRRPGPVARILTSLTKRT